MGLERACAVVDVPQDEAVAVVVGDQAVAITRQGEEFFAIEDQCSHAAVPLSEGEVANCQIECYLHGSTFDLRTGEPTIPPATEPVATFPIEVRGEDVYVDITTTLNGVTPA